MRFLFIDANYPAFLDNIYSNNSGLSGEPYTAQIAKIRDGLFGEAQFQANALVGHGHEADVIITNAHAAQRSWANEHGLRGLSGRRRQFSLKRGLIPWWERRADQTNWEIVFAQAQAYRPDVLYVEIMDTLPFAVATELRKLTRLAVAQIAAPISDAAYRAYDLVFSSIPTMVNTFRAAGIDAAWMPLAFEPTVLDSVPVGERDLPVSFVGSIGSGYPDRSDVLATVARHASLATWTDDIQNLGDPATISTVRGSAFGRDMYSILARSRITLNSHARWAGSDANNLRLYEATGMGALLVTDARRNLGELFSPGQEVVVYESPAEAGEMVRHYLDSPDETTRIAAAGQARTLREHTWMNRAAQMLDLIGTRV